MAAISSLVEFRDCIQNKTKTRRISREYVFIVTEVQRHQIDPGFLAETGIDPEHETEAYDITISDQHHKTKCLLHLSCNNLVQKGQLIAGSFITVTLEHCYLHCNDLDLAADTIIILDQVKVQETYQGDYFNPVFCSFCGHREEEDRPLVGGRGSYLPLWNLEDPASSLWKHQDPSRKFQFPEHRITIDELSTRWKRLQKPYPALVVRVVNKARLRMFGKPCKRDKWPYQLYLEVADNSGICSVTVWGAMCLNLLNSVDEGSVLILQSYTARERFQLMSQPSRRNSTLQTHTVEIGVDKRNPSSHVTIVDPAKVPTDWPLPQLRTNFFSRQQMSSLPDKFNLDVVGVVLSVGRYFRIRRAGSQNFWVCRWIHMVDPSSKQPITVELFSTSQPDVHKAIIPGKVAVLTQMRVVHDISSISQSRQQRTVYVTTTNESQVHLVYADATGPYSSFNAVKNVLRWRVTTECQNLLLVGATIGGCRKLPPLPQTLSDYKASFSEDKPLELTSAMDLKSKLDSLCFLETIRINMQCYVLHVQYVSSDIQSELVKALPVVHQVRTPDKPSPLLVKLRSGRVVRPTSPETSKAESKTALTKQEDSLLTNCVVVDDKFQDLCSSSNVLASKQPLPSSTPRLFKFDTGEAVIKKHLLMPSQKMEMVDVAVPDLSSLQACEFQDHITVTISGLNHQVSLTAHLMLPPTIPRGMSLVNLLAGQGDLRTDSMQTKEDRLIAVRDILKSAAALKNVRLLAVLDAYSTGNETELTINRAYPIPR